MSQDPHQARAQWRRNLKRSNRVLMHKSELSISYLKLFEKNEVEFDFTDTQRGVVTGLSHDRNLRSKI
jgi:hypothetical protein